MRRLCCGIDIGTTNLKVVLADPDDGVVWSRTVPSPRVADGAGMATDAGSLTTCLEELIVDGWREVAGGVPLAAIAAAGVGEDGIGVDAELRPTGLALPWFDERAVEEARELAGTPYASAAAGLRIEPTRTAAKLAWLRRHRPAELTEARAWVALTDYPSVVWSGAPFMSETLAARTACYDVHARSWLEDLLAVVGAPPMPRVAPAGTIVGTVRDGALRRSGATDEATVIVAGGHDHPVAASIIRRAEPDAIIDSMGTAELVYAEIPLPPTPRLDPYLAFSVPVHGGPGLACLCVFQLAAALAPFRRHGADDADVLTELLSAPVLRPSGEAPLLPVGPPTAGLDRLLTRSTADDTARQALRTLEGCAFFTRRMLDAVREIGGRRGALFVTGGWSRSDAFLALRASILGRPIFRLGEEQLVAASAASIAAHAVGLKHSASAALPSVRRIDPVPEWADRYALIYPEIRERLDRAVSTSATS